MPEIVDPEVVDALCPTCRKDASRKTMIVDADCTNPRCRWTGRVRIHRHTMMRTISDELGLYARCPECGERTLQDPEGL